MRPSLTESPPQKPGRPRQPWLEANTLERFYEITGDRRKARTVRHVNFGRHYANFAEQALGIDQRFDNYSAENVERYKPLMRKGILEQLGRYLIFTTNTVGCTQDEAVADIREWADDFLIDASRGELTVENVIGLFRWLRSPESLSEKSEPESQTGIDREQE